MANSKHTKRALLASILSVVLCCAMLIGSTFAWFTDSVTSGKNIIQAGNLDISATYQDVDMDKGTVSYTIPGFDRVPDGTVNFSADTTDINESNAIISENLWEPGAVGAKLITVKNDGNLAAKIKLSFAVEDGGLQNALWFDFVQVKDGAVAGTFIEREMSTLTAVANAVELPLASKGEVSFILLYGMKEEAGNEYRGKSFSADVAILAAQDTVEEDSFDDQYDKDAEYPVYVATAEELKDALANAEDGDTIALTKDIELTNPVNTLNKNITLDAKGNTLSGVPMHITGNDVTVKNAVFDNAKNGQESCVYIHNVGKYVFEGCEFKNTKWDGIQMTGKIAGSELIVNNCTFSNAEQRYIHVEAIVDDKPAINTDVKVTITNNKFGENPNNDAIGLYYILTDGITAYNNTFAAEEPTIYICSSSTSPSISQEDAIKMFTAKQ
ncbi:right-handed parallel beta-helix repeat-containing protein [Hydrogeniiclostridium mannosilyticum]|nr:right-handed parallel beta-helix repeat-containing protein [Hydrogeniiclostridium mannosilyticum]